jgi:hypothetical protein
MRTDNLKPHVNDTTVGMLSGLESMCVCVCVCVCERERERPETDWTQCQNPGDTLDVPMTKMRTSTERKQERAKEVHSEITINSKN